MSNVTESMKERNEKRSLDLVFANLSAVSVEGKSYIAES